MFLPREFIDHLLAAALAGLIAGRLQAGWPLRAAGRAAQPHRELRRFRSPSPAPSRLPLPEDRGQADLEQTLKRLGTTASVLIIVAHPDDEDGALLTYLSRGLGARVTLLTLTRGEGGQNAMTADDYDALGLIRTNELLKADEYYGAKQLWGTEADFGFSKTQEESFAQVGPRARALRRGAGGAPGAAADDRRHLCGRRHRRPRAAPGLRRDRAGGLQGGRRPQGLSRAVERRPCSPGSRWPSIRGCRLRRSPSKGMFDYATGKWAPARFHNYVTGEWINGVALDRRNHSGGHLGPGAGPHLRADCARGLGRAEVAERRRESRR